jgi:hypothetical protein
LTPILVSLSDSEKLMRGQFRIGGVVEKWKEVFFADTDVELSLLLVLSKHLSTQGERE